MYRIGVRKDLHAFPYGVITRRNETGSAAVEEFYGTETTHTGRFQSLVIAEGWNLDTVFLGDLKNILSFFPLNFFTIKLESDHKISLREFGIYHLVKNPVIL